MLSRFFQKKWILAVFIIALLAAFAFLGFQKMHSKKKAKPSLKPTISSSLAVSSSSPKLKIDPIVVRVWAELQIVKKDVGWSGVPSEQRMAVIFKRYNMNPDEMQREIKRIQSDYRLWAELEQQSVFWMDSLKKRANEKVSPH
jgi:hypothetical protein